MRFEFEKPGLFSPFYQGDNLWYAVDKARTTEKKGLQVLECEDCPILELI